MLVILDWIPVQSSKCFFSSYPQPVFYWLYAKAVNSNPEADCECSFGRHLMEFFRKVFFLLYREEECGGCCCKCQFTKWKIQLLRKSFAKDRCLFLVLDSEILRSGLKVIFKTAHCAIAETVHLGFFVFCLINYCSKDINLPSDRTSVLVPCQHCVRRNGYFLFREQKLMMYFKISGSDGFNILDVAGAVYYRLFSSMLYASLFPKTALAVKHRWLSNLYCVSEKKNL